MVNTANEYLLVQKAKSDDKEAFSLLVKEYCKPLYGFAFKLTERNHMDAENITQETWLRVYRNIKTYSYNKDNSKFLTWLCEIAKNYWRDVCKKPSIEKEKYIESIFKNNETGEIEYPPSSELTSDKIYEQKHLLFPEEMPVFYKAILYYKYVEERSVDEIVQQKLLPDYDTTDKIKKLLLKARDLYKQIKRG